MVVKACLIFAFCILVFMLLYSWITDSSVFHRLVTFTASATATVLHVFDGDVYAFGTEVASPDFAMGIIEACTGVVPMLIFLAAVLAYPSPNKRKALGIVIGILGLYAVNIIRTTTLFAVGVHFPSFFDTAHYIVWQSLMILVAVVFWLLWVSRLAHVTSK